MKKNNVDVYMCIIDKYMTPILWAYVLSIGTIRNAIISGGQLWNHWFGIKFWHKWTYKTIEFY